jgi:hypothetical protein
MMNSGENIRSCDFPISSGLESHPPLLNAIKVTLGSIIGYINYLELSLKLGTPDSNNEAKEE